MQLRAVAFDERGEGGLVPRQPGRELVVVHRFPPSRRARHIGHQRSTFFFANFSLCTYDAPGVANSPVPGKPAETSESPVSRAASPRHTC